MAYTPLAGEFIVEGACHWPPLDDSCCPVADGSDRWLSSVTSAAGWLFRETGERFVGSGCTRMLRPPTDCCTCSSCACVGWGRSQPIHLAPRGVVVDSVEFWVGGVHMNAVGNPQNVQLVQTSEGTYAIRTDGQQWPEGQDFSYDPTQMGSNCAWGLVVEWSAQPPQILLDAVTHLACHIMGECTSAGDCCDKRAIPKYVESYTDGSVTYRLGSLSSKLRRDGFTGIDLVDLALYQLRYADDPTTWSDPLAGSIATGTLPSSPHVSYG